MKKWIFALTPPALLVDFSSLVAGDADMGDSPASLKATADLRYLVERNMAGHI